MPSPMGPPESVSETFTTLPESFGAAGEVLDADGVLPGRVAPLIIAGPEGVDEEGRSMRPKATAADATRAITAAARAPTIAGRLRTVIESSFVSPVVGHLGSAMGIDNLGSAMGIDNLGSAMGPEQR